MPLQAEEGQVERGKQLFEAICRRCHVPDSPVFPGLEGLFKRKGLPFSQKPITEGNVRNQILFGGTAMQPVAISNEELDDLLTYLKTL